MHITDLKDDNAEVCLCQEITLKDIKEAYENGAHTLDEMMEATGAGTICGACQDVIQEFIDSQN